jgi:hypothetical protein
MEDLYVTGQFDIFVTDCVNILQKTEQFEYLGKLNGREWASLFYGVLGCPTFSEVGQDLSNGDQHILYQLRFKEALSDFQMLQRLDDIYKKVVFDIEQVKMLRKEVFQVLLKAKSNKHADSGLIKLQNACDIAIERKHCLILEGW